MVGEHLDKRVGDLTRLLSSEDASNPLVAIQMRATKAMLESEERHRKQLTDLRESHSKESRGLQEQVAALREALARVFEKQEGDERVAEAEEAGTRKGRSFEERVHEALESIAEGRGDVAVHTGDVKGEGGSKKGDTVIEIGAAEGQCGGRIVFEDKDRQLSKNKMREELNGALAEREADFAVLVVAGEDRIPVRARAADRVRGQQDHRRRRSRGARRPRPTARLPLRPPAGDDGPRPGARRRRRRRAGRGRGGPRGAEASAGGPSRARQHRQAAPRRRARASTG